MTGPNCFPIIPVITVATPPSTNLIAYSYHLVKPTLENLTFTTTPGYFRKAPQKIAPLISHTP